jgi:hypothetical protein
VLSQPRLAARPWGEGIPQHVLSAALHAHAGMACWGQQPSLSDNVHGSALRTSFLYGEGRPVGSKTPCNNRRHSLLFMWPSIPEAGIVVPSYPLCPPPCPASSGANPSRLAGWPEWCAAGCYKARVPPIHTESAGMTSTPHKQAEPAFHNVSVSLDISAP